MTLRLAPTTHETTIEPLGELIFLNRRDDAHDAECASSSPAIRVLIADGHALVRAGLRALLDGEDGIAVAGEAATGEEVVSVARTTNPDVVMIDIGLPGLDALDTTRRIVADPALEGVRVMILTPVGGDEQVFEALHAGASGFLVKDTQPTELLQAVRALAHGHALLAPSATRRVIAELTSRPQRDRPAFGQLEELTEREREVMALVAQGLSNGEIAERLVVSPATARTHVSRAMVKLHARNRAQLVVLAYQAGLVPRAGAA